MGLFSRNKEFRTCDICHKQGSSKDDKKKIIENVEGKFHQKCYEQENEKIIQEITENEKEVNPDFAKRKFDFNDGLEQVVEVLYEKKREVDVKLFFSNDNWSTFSRNYKERVNDNFVRFIIQISRKTNAKLIGGGNFDFNDDFSKGYTLFVLMKYSDKRLLSTISTILRSKKFGCLPTNFSIHAHLNDENPTEEDGKQILSEITGQLLEVLKQKP